MAWWHKKPFQSAYEDQTIESRMGAIIPCDNPKEVVIVPKDPEPDLSTKPKDSWKFALGLVCRKNKHFVAACEQGWGPSDLQKVNPVICSKCGSTIVFASVKIRMTPKWLDGSRYNHSGYDTKIPSSRAWELWPKNWGDWKFVRFPDDSETPKRRKK